MKRHVATYRKLHDLTNAPKPSSNKGGDKNDGATSAGLDLSGGGGGGGGGGGELLFGDEGMAY
jgi:hypothetical protein